MGIEFGALQGRLIEDVAGTALAMAADGITIQQASGNLSGAVGMPGTRVCVLIAVDDYADALRQVGKQIREAIEEHQRKQKQIAEGN